MLISSYSVAIIFSYFRTFWISPIELPFTGRQSTLIFSPLPAPPSSPILTSAKNLICFSVVFFNLSHTFFFKISQHEQMFSLFPPLTLNFQIPQAMWVFQKTLSHHLSIRFHISAIITSESATTRSIRKKTVPQWKWLIENELKKFRRLVIVVLAMCDSMWQRNVSKNFK